MLRTSEAPTPTPISLLRRKGFLRCYYRRLLQIPQFSVIINVDIVSISCRKVVEHVCLLKAKGDLSEQEESDMLDHLYTTQYQMGGIVAISLGIAFAFIGVSYIHTLHFYYTQNR